MWPHSWCLPACVWGDIQRRGQLYPVRSPLHRYPPTPNVSRRGKQSQTISSPASAPDTDHFRPPADVSPPYCPHMLTSAQVTATGLLCSFKCLQMAVHGFQCQKSRLFGWPGDDRCGWPGTKTRGAGDDAGQISGLLNDATPAQHRCTLYKTDKDFRVRHAWSCMVRFEVVSVWNSS